MNNKKIDEKLNKLVSKIELLILHNASDVETIHKIRTSSREILSLLDSIHLDCSSIKNIIKLSNEIRDIDVMLENFLSKLPNELIEHIDIDQIHSVLLSKRENDFKIFLNYLTSFINKNLEFLNKSSSQTKNNDNNKITLSFKKKELHKYRIFIKKQLYYEKNIEDLNLQKINILTKIKDILGSINDNRNGLKILKKNINDKSKLKNLKLYTKTENLKLFEQAKDLIQLLEREI